MPGSKYCRFHKPDSGVVVRVWKGARAWLSPRAPLIVAVLALIVAFRELRHATMTAEVNMVTELLLDDLLFCSGLESIPGVQRGTVDRLLLINRFADLQLARLFLSAAQARRAAKCVGVNLSHLNVSLEGQDDGGSRVRVYGLDLSGLIHEARFGGFDVWRSNWSALRADGVQMSNIAFHEGTWRDVKGSSVSMPEVSVRDMVWYGVTLSDCDLKGATLDELSVVAGSALECSFDGAQIRNSSFEKVLERSSFVDVVFYNVDFTSAKLGGAIFDRARLEDVNFDGSDLVDASFRGARIGDGVSFTDATLTGAIFDGACIVLGNTFKELKRFALPDCK